MSTRDGRLRDGRWLLAAAPMIWLAILFIAPFAIVVKIALSSAVTAQPPYAPAFDVAAGWDRFLNDLGRLSMGNFQTLAGDAIYLEALLNSLLLAATATFILLCICYPLAVALARLPARWKALGLTLLILPFWTSFLIRVYAWIGILRQDGYLNNLLIWLGLISEPVTFLNTNGAIVLGLVYAYLPFMALPLYASITRLDPVLLEAAADLGCRPWNRFRLVVLPLTMPAAVAGAILVFVPAVGELIIPELLGGSDTLMIGRTLWSEFFSNRDWPLASALAIMLLMVLLPPILLYRIVERQSWERRT